MMWWGADGSWATGWWWPGIVFMIICVVMMSRMMRHGMSGSHHSHRGSRREETPERILASRLANREIDLDQYTRLLEAIRRPAGSTGP